MKANELRIGSIVMVDNPEHHPRLKGVALRVTGSYEDAFKGENEYAVMLQDVKNRNTYAQLIRFIKPIELTEDILLKCGFAVVYDSDYTKRLALIEDTRFDFLINKLDFESSGIRYKGDTHYHNARYLHELQNLYYAITKQELEVQL